MGQPLDRLVLFLPTLHPEILSRVITWAPDEPVEISDQDYRPSAVLLPPGNPIGRAMAEREAVTVGP